MNLEREECTPVEEEIMPFTQEQEEQDLWDTQYNLNEFLILNKTVPQTEIRNGSAKRHAAGTLQQLDVGNSTVEVQGKGGHSFLHIVNSNTQNKKAGEKTLPEGPEYTGNLYFCSNCRNCYHSSATRKIHERACLRQNSEDHQCKECHKVYSSAGNLKQHMKMHSGIVPLRCNRCFRKFFDEKNYRAHMDRHKRREEVEAQHSGKDVVVKEFNCVFCKRNFRAVFDAGQVKRRFTCDTCLQKYNSAEIPGQRPQRDFSCNRCGRKYVFQSFLMRHQPTCDGTFKRIHSRRET